jgi:hypothetical protein
MTETRLAVFLAQLSVVPSLAAEYDVFDPHRATLVSRHAKGRKSRRWLHDDHEQRHNTRQSQLRFR